MQRLLLSIIVIISCFACAKEIDETIPKETILGDPELRDETLVRSNVKNFDGNAIPFATIKFVADNNFTIPIESDEYGHFQFSVPSNIMHGHIIIAKEKHDRVIINYDNSNLVISNDIRLPDNDAIDNIDLSFDENNSFHVTGRLVDGLEQPIANMEYFVSGVLPSGEYKDYGHYFTNEDGLFSIIDERDNGVTSFTFHSRLSEDRCSETLDSLIEQLPMLDLDDLVFQIENEEEVTIEISETDCSTNVLAKAYYINQQEIGLQNLPLGEIDLPSCPNYSSSVLYVGFEDANGENFNGEFRESNAQANNYPLISCTGSGYFFNISYNGEDSLLDAKYDTTVNEFVVNSGSSQIYFDSEIKALQPTDCINANCDRFMLTAFDKFAFQFGGNLDFEYSEGEVYMDNVRNTSSEISGIIMNVNSNKPDLKIRFRVQKI